MEALPARYERLSTDLRYARRRNVRVQGAWEHPDFQELMALEARTWKSGLGRIEADGVPMAGLGFAGLPLPNTEPVNAPAATTGVAVETNLYTPATTTNADWALLPQGSIRSPQTWVVLAGGVYTSSATSQTCAFTSRIGTSGTPSSNQSLGATGAVSLGNATAVTNGLWQYQANVVVTAAGTSAKANAQVTVTVSNQAAGSVTASQLALAGNTTATFDSTLQQGYVISVTPSAAGVSVQMLQFCILVLD